MRRASMLALGLVGGAVAAAGAWSLYQRVETETVPYTVVGRVGDVELRRYRPVVVAETVAATENQAFGRLFRYLTGANRGSADLAMTAPVEVRGRGTSLRMTAPVETSADRDDSGVRMAFYLPAEYGIETAPEPTDDDVELARVPERTLAVRQFSWRPTDRRVARERDRLLETLERAEVPTVGTPFFLGYDAPWTLPFLRRNEVAVELEAGHER
jgi:hypothetical protein